MAIRFEKLLVPALILASVGCGPFFVKPGTNVKKTDAPPPVANVSASTRKEALAKITELVKKEQKPRVYKTPQNHGWIEEYEIIKVEDIGIQPARNGGTEMTCRITSSVSRYKTQNEKKKGEPTVFENVKTRRFVF